MEGRLLAPSPVLRGAALQPACAHCASQGPEWPSLAWACGLAELGQGGGGQRLLVVTRISRAHRCHLLPQQSCGQRSLQSLHGGPPRLASPLGPWSAAGPFSGAQQGSASVSSLSLCRLPSTSFSPSPSPPPFLPPLRGLLTLGELSPSLFGLQLPGPSDRVGAALGGLGDRVAQSRVGGFPACRTTLPEAGPPAEPRGGGGLQAGGEGASTSGVGCGGAAEGRLSPCKGPRSSSVLPRLVCRCLGGAGAA